MFDVFKTGIKSAYSISESASFQVGGWRVHHAKHRLTGKKVSVFIFDKTKFESQVQRMCSQSSAFNNSKLIIEDTHRLLKYEASQLTKLKHPQILSIVEPLEESKLKFTFVTEPVKSTLGQSAAHSGEESFIIKGLYEISKALQFLQEHCGIVHQDLQPWSVFVTEDGDWKLGGFKFLQLLQDFPEQSESFNIDFSSIVSFTNLNLDFTAPELVMDLFGQKLSTANDMWSLGMLIFWLYNDGEQLINCLDKISISDYRTEYKNLERKITNNSVENLGFMLKKVPKKYWQDMSSLICKNPRDRISIDEFLALSFFKGSFIKIMLTLDEFPTNVISEKIEFVEELSSDQSLVTSLPSAMITTKLIPIFVNTIESELRILKDATIERDRIRLISCTLKLVLTLGSALSSMSFVDRIFATILKPSAKSNESTFTRLVKTSPLVRLAIVSNFETLNAKLPHKDVVDMMKFLTEPCLLPGKEGPELNNDQILLQNEVLSKLNIIAPKYDYLYLKQTLVPLLCKSFKTTTVLSTKIGTISTFKALMIEDAVDKALFEEQILPVFENIKSRNKEIVDSMLSFFMCLIFESKIKFEPEEIVEKILCRSLCLAFGCLDCNRFEFNTFLNKLQTLQTHVAQQKMMSMPGDDSTDLNNFHVAKPRASHSKPITVSSQYPGSSSNFTRANNSTLRNHTSSINKKEPANASSFTGTVLEDKEPLNFNSSTINKADALVSGGFTTSDTETTLPWNTIQQRTQSYPAVLSPSFKALEPNKNARIPPGFATHQVLTPRKI